jgi:flagellin-like protein
MNGKRGISPLIATVLLIGFAVALGVMIMSITQPLSKDNCDDLKMNAMEFCKNGNKLFAVIEGKEGKTVCENIMIDTDQIQQTCPATS